MFSKFRSLFVQTPLKLSSFKEVRTVCDDNFNGIKDGTTILKYYDGEKEIGFINYRPFTGQVGVFVLEKEYRNKGLGKQILLKAMKEIESKNVHAIWAVTTFEHTFWSNVFNGSMHWKEPAHNNNDSTITGSGYWMKI